MSPYNPMTWSWTTVLLAGLAAYYSVEFVRHWFLFRRVDARLARGEIGRDDYNASLKGWPAFGYAKMLARTPLQDGEEAPPASRHGPAGRRP